MKDFIIRRFSHMRWLHNLLGGLGYQIVMIGIEFQDVPQTHRDVYRKVKPFTMTSEHSVYTLIRCLEHLHRYQIPGNIVECGVWRGGMMMAALEGLKLLKDASRHVYLYDTFEGMAEPGINDEEKAMGLYRNYKRADGSSDWCRSTLDEVKSNLAACGYDPSKLHFIQGKVEDSIPGTLPGEIALLRLDTDWYESTRHEFEHLFPLVVKGGFVIIDDYGAWAGSRKATDEYLESHGLSYFLHRVDTGSRIFVKT